MPKYLSEVELYDIIQRELPEDVYPYGSPDQYLASADSDSTAKVFSTMYSNLARIYENYYPMTTDERIADWETQVFGYNLDTSLTLTQRRDRVIAKIRARYGFSVPDMQRVVESIIGNSHTFQIVELGCEHGSWLLEESELEVETFLGGSFPFDWTTVGDLCGLTAMDFGVTEQELLDAREDAYTYEVRIYTYTLTSIERDSLDAALSREEPARSQHIILDGLNIADYIGGGT